MPIKQNLVVAEQISWIVDRTPLHEDAISDETYSRLLYKLQKFSRNHPITWLIDGLSFGKGGDFRELEEVATILPLGTREFCFVFTSEIDISAYLRKHQRNIKAMDIMLVSPDEARAFLSDIITEERDIQEIRAFCRSNIGRMQKIRTLLQEEVSLDELLSQKNESLEALFELEWDSISHSEALSRIIATVVFSERPLSLKELASLTGISEPQANTLISESKILSCGIQERETIVSIDSRAQRSFAAKKLAHLEKEVRNNVIDRMLRGSNEKDATRYLPIELSKVGRHAEIIEYLNPQHFVRLLETEQTLRSLKHHAELGCVAARKIDDFSTELAFSLLCSVTRGLTFSVGTVEQIEALIKLGEHEIAQEIASIAPTTEERLHLLARAAYSLDACGYPAPQDLIDQIKLLLIDIDGKSIGDLGIDIACDLLAVDFKLASDLLDKVVEGAKKWLEESRTDADSDNDLLRDENSASPSDENPKRRPKEIPEHKLQRFTHEISRRLERQKFEHLLENLKDENPSFALLICKRWLAGNRNTTGAFKVADAALDFMLSDTSRAPQIQDLREIGQILPFLSNREEVSQLAGRIETQFRILGHHGTSAETIRLRMQLFAAKYDGAQDEVELDLINLFIEIESLTELSTKATCWAWMLHHLCSSPQKNLLDKSTDLTSLAAQHLETTINGLLAAAADHFKASKDAIDAIAQTDPKKAYALVERLNNVSARDKGFESLARTLLPSHKNSASVIVKSINSIKDDFRRNRLSVYALMTLRRRRLASKVDEIDDALLSLWKGIDLSTYRFQAAAVVLAYHLEAGQEEAATKLQENLERIWDSVPTEPIKIELGYLAASELADANRSLAMQWIERAEQLARHSNVGSGAITGSIFSTLSLCVRLLPTVFPRGGSCDESDAFRRISFLVPSLGSPELELRIWCNLTIRQHFSGHTVSAKEIVERHILPILDQDFENNDFLRSSLVVEAAPALYLIHQSSALHRIDNLKSYLSRERARANIITVLLHRSPLWEPFQTNRKTEYILDPNATTDILNLLKGCSTDSFIYGVVSDLCRSLNAEKNKHRIQRNAALDYLRTLEKIVEDLLPDKNNIKHEGFLIACQALIFRARFDIQKESATNQTPHWEALYSRAQGISNVADRTVVTALVGVNSRCKAGSTLVNWMEKVRSDIAIIPSAFDRLDRYEWIARIVEPADKPAARALLAEGLKLSNYLPATDDVVQHQRNILDFAHIIDASLATDLIQKFDTDEARKAPLKKRLETHSKRKKLATHPDSEELNDLEDEQLTDICYENLGSLIAGRISTRPLEEFKAINVRARNMPIREAAPIWDWVVENAVRKRNPSTSSIDQNCKKLFEATCKAAEIANGLIGKLARYQSPPNSTHGTIRGGDRELFISRITKWASSQDGCLICISDPYFSPADIEFIKSLSQAAPNSKFRVATSREQMKKKQISSPEESFLEAWEARFDFDPPATEFAVVGYGSEGKHPIHDRWIVTETSGLRIGSSLNSIGLTRTSDLSDIPALDAKSKWEDINIYFDRPPKIFAGERLTRALFSI